VDKSNKHGGRGVEEKSDAEQKRREDEKEPSGTGKKNSQSAESDSRKSTRPRK
jgi:hypothetical protein